MIRILCILAALFAASPAFAWTPYAVHGGSYFYGFAVADFDKDGNPDVAYVDSLAATNATEPA
jgi:hypothetical protein